MTPGSFWETEAWKSFEQWARVLTIDVCQGSLGHTWLAPTRIGTNLNLSHLKELPRQGGPHPERGTRVKDVRWSVGLKKEIVEALAGKVKGPTVEELDATISRARDRIQSGSSEDQLSNSSSSSVLPSAPSQPRGHTVLDDEPPDVELNVLTAAQKEEWRSHILRGHLPYRRDCKYCVEGSGLGVQHRRVKHPQAFSLSIDLFGPMSGAERGRDEQSVSGNPHLKFGLVGVFRLPKMVVEPCVPLPDLPPDAGVEVDKSNPTHQPVEDDELAEYEPSPPDDAEDDLFAELDNIPLDDDLHEQRAVSGHPPIEDDEVLKEAVDQEEDWLDDEKLDTRIKDLMSGVELVSLRYMIGLKSKSGPDVTAGVQKLILAIAKMYPVKVLHCDPGTEFTSDKMTAWLAQQGVRLQTTLPTDKQGNGVAERAVGWFKSRARTLLASGGLSPAYWPLAMRYASECYNRQVLRGSPLPAFGQTVLHKLKRPSGSSKDLMAKWISATYAAPHLTIPDGHVLVTPEGNLVASRGFKTNLVDTRAEEELELPILQSRDDGPSSGSPDSIGPEPLEHGELESLQEPTTPSKRLREKTAVRFLDIEDHDDPEQLARHAILDQDVSDEAFRRILALFERAELPTDDRRGEFKARYILGAFCHGGQRGVTTLARRYPLVVRFLNSFLRSRLDTKDREGRLPWSTILVMQATDVAVHRDYRNEWGSRNLIVHIPGSVELWTSPITSKEGTAIDIQPDWASSSAQVLGRGAIVFDARNHHAVRRTPDWLLVGYSPLGVHKLIGEDKGYLTSLGFALPRLPLGEVQVKAVRHTAKASSDRGSIPVSSSNPSLGQSLAGVLDSQRASQSSANINEDLQEDSHTILVGWDPTAADGPNVRQDNLEEADLGQYLREREVEWTAESLMLIGVESPADLAFLYVEDLVESGLPHEDARRIMMGIHPTGTVRPDNPNMISLTTGEVCLFDRGQRQIPRVIQNRTLGYHAPGPPVLGLGINMQATEEDPIPYLEDWQELNGYPPVAANMPPEPYPPVDPTASSSGHAWPSRVDERPSGSTSVPGSSSDVWPQHVSATDGDIHSAHALWMQAVWDAESEEEFDSLVNPKQLPIEPEGLGSPKQAAEGLGSGSSSYQGRVDFSCRMLSCTDATDKPGAGTIHTALRNPRSPLMSSTTMSVGIPQIGVFIPPIVSAVTSQGSDDTSPDETQDPTRIEKVEENSYTSNIEQLLDSLTAPLEVVHQVSPADVRNHLQKWKVPAQEEVSSMEGMNAIVRRQGNEAKELLKLPNVEVLPSKGVFTVKPGKPYRRKVRVVSCGNFAKSVSEEVLYASGAAAEVLRTCLVYSGVKRRQCWSTDIKCAFLLAPIPSTVQKVYVLKPPAILVALGVCQADEYWEVRRAVYGFKESPKWWSQYRDAELAKACFPTTRGQARLLRTSSDDNLWQIFLDDKTCVGHVLVYVDDILMLCNQSVAEAFHGWIKGKWGCSDLERAMTHKALRFLGVDIYEVCDEFGTRGYTLSQEGYIDELVRSHGLEYNARAVIPLPKEWVKSAPEEEKDYDASLLRDAQKITGELLWVSQRTRLDICFSVGLMSSWTTRSPGFVIKIGLRVLAYLANTKGIRLSLVPNESSSMSIYTDASFAPFSERSITGVVVMMCSCCVIWKSRRQTLVSLSTAECELIAAIEGIVLGQSVEALIKELWDDPVKLTLHVDNTAAIALAEGGGSQRTRHLRVRACYLRDQLEQNHLEVLHCPGEVQLADALTKALPAPRLIDLNRMLGLGQYPNLDPAVQAVMTTSRALQRAEPSEGQSILLILALMMTQVVPAASQEEEGIDGVSLDLYILAVMLACSILFVWEVGKHCIREYTCPRRAEASVASVRANDEDHQQRRQRR